MRVGSAAWRKRVLNAALSDEVAGLGVEMLAREAELIGAIRRFVFFVSAERRTVPEEATIASTASGAMALVVAVVVLMMLLVVVVVVLVVLLVVLVVVLLVAGIATATKVVFVGWG